MFTRASKVGSCALFLSVLCLAVVAQADDGPKISEMEEVVADDAATVSQEVQLTVEDAQARLKAGDAPGAKKVLMTRRMLHRLSATDLRAISQVEDKVNEALGDAWPTVEKQLEEKIKAESDLPPSEADEMLAMYRRLREFQRKHDQLKAQRLVKLAKQELYDYRHPKKAEELAAQAKDLDPDNKEAHRIYTEALADRDPSARWQFDANVTVWGPRLRLQTLNQQLGNDVAMARDLSAHGKHAEAVSLLKDARDIAGALSIYQDVQTKAAEIEKLLADAEAADEAAQRKLSALREEEARKELAKQLSLIEEAAMKKQAALFDQIYHLGREGRYVDALRLLDTIQYEDPASPAARWLEKDVARDMRADTLKHLTWEEERQANATRAKTLEQSIPYSKVMRFPDRKDWFEVISERTYVRYPSEMAAEEIDRRLKDLAEAERIKNQGVYDLLMSETVELNFDDPLPRVIEFLDEITPVHFSLLRRDLDMDENPVSLDVKTTLKSALELICEQADMGWAVDDGLVLIARKSTLAGREATREVVDYETRVYDIRDLLVNTEDWDAGSTRSRSRDTGRRDRDGYDSDNRGGGYGTTDRDTGGRTGYRGSSGGGTRRRGEAQDLWERAYDLEDLMKETIVADWQREAGERRRQRSREEEGDWGEGGFWEEERGAAGFGEEGEEAVQRYGGVVWFREGQPGEMVVMQEPEVHRQIENLLADLRRSMAILVHVETRFIEISAEFFSEIGFKAYTADLGGSEQNATVDLGVPFFAEARGFLDLDVELATQVFSGDLVLRALQSHDSAKTLSNPVITLMNGQQGFIEVSRNTWYVAEFDVQDGIPVPVPEEVESTIELTVRPIVSADRRYVFLELSPDITDVLSFQVFSWTTAVAATGEEGGEPTLITNIIQQPITTEQRFATTVVVPDRGTLMVGGLTRREKQEHETGIPILNKIPIIKRFFSAEGKKVDDRTLVILVRPQILMPDEEEGSAY